MQIAWHYLESEHILSVANLLILFGGFICSLFIVEAETIVVSLLEIEVFIEDSAEEILPSLNLCVQGIHLSCFEQHSCLLAVGINCAEILVFGVVGLHKNNHRALGIILQGHLVDILREAGCSNMAHRNLDSLHLFCTIIICAYLVETDSQGNIVHILRIGDRGQTVCKLRSATLHTDSQLGGSGADHKIVVIIHRNRDCNNPIGCLFLPLLKSQGREHVGALTKKQFPFSIAISRDYSLFKKVYHPLLKRTLGLYPFYLGGFGIICAECLQSCLKIMTFFIIIIIAIRFKFLHASIKPIEPCISLYKFIFSGLFILTLEIDLNHGRLTFTYRHCRQIRHHHAIHLHRIGGDNGEYTSLGTFPFHIKEGPFGSSVRRYGAPF